MQKYFQLSVLVLRNDWNIYGKSRKVRREVLNGKWKLKLFKDVAYGDNEFFSTVTSTNVSDNNVHSFNGIIDENLWNVFLDNVCNVDCIIDEKVRNVHFLLSDFFFFF